MKTIKLTNSKGDEHVTTEAAWKHAAENERLRNRGWKPKTANAVKAKETQVILNDREALPEGEPVKKSQKS